MTPQTDNLAECVPWTRPPEAPCELMIEGGQLRVHRHAREGAKDASAVIAVLQKGFSEKTAEEWALIAKSTSFKNFLAVWRTSDATWLAVPSEFAVEPPLPPRPRPAEKQSVSVPPPQPKETKKTSLREQYLHNYAQYFTGAYDPKNVWALKQKLIYLTERDPDFKGLSVGELNSNFDNNTEEIANLALQRMPFEGADPDQVFGIDPRNLLARIDARLTILRTRPAPRAQGPVVVASYQTRR